MARQAPEYRAIHHAGNAIEPRAARAFRLAVARLRSRLPLAELRQALRNGDMRTADELITRLDIEDAFEPVAAIIRDAVIRGGKIAAEDLP